MPAKSAVRWLVALEILLVIVALSIEAPGPYSPFSSGWGIEKWSEQAPLLGWPLLIFGVAAYIGVFQFKPWGRKSYLIYHLLDLVSILVPSVVHMPPLGAVFYWASYVAVAIVLYLLYLTPLKVHFKKKEAAAEPAGPEIPDTASEENPADRAQESSGKKENTAPGPKALESPVANNKGNLVDRVTDWLFPRTAKTRAAKEPPMQRNKRRALLMEHYVFILFIMFVIMLTEFRINGLVIVALCFVVYNLAQRKGTPFIVLFPALLAGYCLIPVASSLFGYMLSDFSKSFLPYLIPYIAGWLLLFLLEVRTHKFIRNYDQPPPEPAKDEAP
ncbi:MAG: hypothetical protein KJ808_05915 [Acidobacteria bacterium]|nr:hypothetical protein [Acidobacteriota bacterium]MBU4307049.1 hypothetical protein [Acidobacteriota bacterium]MBU4405789.1 hypothetical protein [Acidobacteriota bacterium]MCG2810254.1 hypothetical protein [Candidatus Aminicenantes bacterium]